MRDVFDRMPPYDENAERATISAAALDREVFEECRSILPLNAFFSADHQIVWTVICDLYARRVPVDALLVRAELGKRHLLEEIGGADFLADVLNAMPSAAHGAHYARIVANDAKKRSLIEAANQTLRDCYAATRAADPADAIAAALERAAARVRETGHADTTRRLEEVVHSVIETKETGAATRLYTGLTDLDVLTGGVPLSLHTLVAGRAGMGKSQLCKQMARNIASGIPARVFNDVDAFGTGTLVHLAEQPPHPVGIITIEENAEKIATNYLAATSNVENNHIAYNRLDGREWRQLSAAVPRLASLPIFIDDAQRKLSDIERVARRMVRKYGVRAIVVDHLHLIDGEMDANREQELSRISGGLKGLWKYLRVAGLVALQMNRGGGADRAAVPEMDQLRGSGSLEQDGDLIVQLYREDYFKWKEPGFVPSHRLDVYVNKNKDGLVGMRHAYFDGDSQTVTDWNDGRGAVVRYAEVQ